MATRETGSADHPPCHEYVLILCDPPCTRMLTEFMPFERVHERSNSQDCRRCQGGLDAIQHPWIPQAPPTAHIDVGTEIIGRARRGTHRVRRSRGLLLFLTFSYSCCTCPLVNDQQCLIGSTDCFSSRICSHPTHSDAHKVVLLEPSTNHRNTGAHRHVHLV
jgi:hypothetical protein